jgi:hypothetical protein
MAGRSFTSVCGQVKVKPAVDWQVLALSGLYILGIITFIRDNYSPERSNIEGIVLLIVGHLTREPFISIL